MKTLPISILAAMVAIFLVSCERDKGDLDAKLEKLEKDAAAAAEKQRVLEEELAQRKLAAEISEIERERTRLEEERLAMESELRDKDEKLAAEFEQRQRDLEERERKLAEQAEEQDKRQQDLTGLEEKLDEKERDVAGRAPINSMPEGRDVNFGSATGDYSTFYDSLSDYGSWFQTSDYGYVYQPTIVRDSSWRPYTRGRWALTNHGWTWVSSEPFGWACYHYGRWALLRGIGWVWVPGTEWAPAWVTWRESPGHVGWAPLPPETLGWRSRAWDASVEVTFGIGSGWFTFVSYKNFGGNIQPYCLPVVQNTTIFRQTTNITIYQIRDRRIYVGGPSYRNVCDRIGRQFPIHHLSVIDDYSSRRGAGDWSNRFRGDELQVIAPRIDADWNSALSPGRIRRDLGRVEVDRSRDLSSDVRDQFRRSRATEKQRAEKVVAEAGGREQLDRYRRAELGRNRAIEKSEDVVREDGKPKPEGAIPVVPDPPTRIRDRGPQNIGGDGKIEIVDPPAPEFTGGEPKPETFVPKPTGLEGEGQNPTETVLPKPEVPGQDEDSGNRMRDRDRLEEIRRQEEELKEKQEELREQQEDAARAGEKAKQEQENVMRKRAEQMRREREERENGIEEERRNREFEESERKQKEEDAMRREQEEQAQRAKEEANREQEDGERMNREKAGEARRLQEEMRKQQEETLRQQKEVEKQRKAQEEALQRQQKELKKQEEEAQRKAQEEVERRQREEMQRQKQEEALRQKEEMRQKQEEQSRRMREELERRQQEEQAKRQQQEEMKRQQEEVRRQQQEEMRRQQDEARRQQEEMRRQQQEEARQQQEERKRQSDERVRRQREGN